MKAARDQFAQRSAKNELPTRSRHGSVRAGFTLVEMVIVIVIIAILMALLLPAISAVRRNARITQVKAEIADLSTAIANFKTSRGIEPPSQITLVENGGEWDTRTMGLLRRMWPQFDFSLDHDWNGDGTIQTGNPGKTTLTGAECLVFFLGGIRDTNGALVGFSKNPRNPFQVGGNREGPFMEFNGGFDTTKNAWTGQFVDINQNGAPEYHDPLPSQTMPYLYFSSYDGRGYRVGLDGSGNWLNIDCVDPVSSQPLIRYAYYTSFDTTDPNKSSPYKPNAFQIISPGYDKQYGTGGKFDPENPGILDPFDQDNITNFDGPLGG